MKTMITGVRPTGNITLANYIGGIKSFVEKQKEYGGYRSRWCSSELCRSGAFWYKHAVRFADFLDFGCIYLEKFIFPVELKKILC